MNKRKTLRMTSILLALMMFFGMVSVLLVPSGVAGAADAQVDITIDTTTSSTYDSDNVIVLDNLTYTLKVSKLLWANSNNDFVNVRMVLKNWKGEEVTGYTSSNPKVMTASTTESGMYTCEFVASTSAYKASNPGQTGLYTMELRRYYANGTMDQTALKVGAFWLAEQATAEEGEITDANPQKLAVNDGTLYVGPEAKIKYDLDTAPTGFTSINGTWGSAGAKRTGEFRLVDPIKRAGFIKTFNLATATGTYTYTVPSTATHDQKLSFFGLAIDEDMVNCMAVDFEYEDTTPSPSEWYSIGYIDAKAPVVSGAIIQNSELIDRIWSGGFVLEYAGGVYNVADPDINYVEIESILDADSGFVATDQRFSEAYIVFQNPLNAKVKIGDYDTTPITYFDSVNTTTSATNSYYINKKNNEGSFVYNINSARDDRTDWTSENTSFYDDLINKRWDVYVYARDNVGNESSIKAGTYDFLGDYVQIKEIRVEQQNVLEMYVGQTINYEDVLFNGVKVAINSDASFPENYIWFGNNDIATLKLFDFDYDAKTITAKAAGEGKIYVEPWINYIDEDTATDASKNGYMKVIVHAEPTVSSLTLSSSKLALAVGAEHKLTATIVPAGVTATWSSTDTAVATVDQNGNVKAVAAGTTTVSVAAGGKYAVCTVTVSDATVIPDPDPPAEDLKGWVDEGNNRYYYVDNQKVVGWRKIDGSWYFFDYSTAAMRANGWLKEGGKWYYLNSNGTMKSAEWFKDNNGKWYWLKANGAMAAGWEKINGTWYYFNASGAMQTGWVNVRGIWYYMKSSGAMAEGWLQDGGSWYYLTPGGGAMVTGRVTINGRASNFATSGRWLGYV